ncbi:MAG: hypothetical protein FJ119_00820 [Deltaproteobacteria bacterium]|nr:hypothetical protein [Deltaproteobacteria bacterium]
MEQSPSWQGLPPESVEGTALLVFFVSLACACVALFGERRLVACLVFTAACTLVLYVCLRLRSGRRTGTGFTIDDGAQSLRVHGSRPIPLKAVASLRLILYRDRACLHAMTGALRRRQQVACVSRPGPVQDIVDALTGRGLTVRISRNPFRKSTAELIPLLIMPLLAAMLLYVSIDMFRRGPGLALPPQQLSVEPAQDRAGKEIYHLGPVALMLPRGYRLIDRQPDALIVHSPAGDTRIAIEAGPDRRTVAHNALLQALAGLLGFGNVHDAALLAVHSRFGLMPAMIKAALLKRYDADTVQTYCLRAGALSGVMLRGEQARPGENALEHMPDQVAEIMLRTPDRALIIRVLIASRAPLAVERITGLISGIHLGAQD